MAQQVRSTQRSSSTRKSPRQGRPRTSARSTKRVPARKSVKTTATKSVRAPAKKSASPAAQRSGHQQKRAAERALHTGAIKIPVPVLGSVELPPPDHLAWYVGLGALAAVEIIEWPIAVLLATGKILADNRHSRVLEEFGDALDQAG